MYVITRIRNKKNDRPKWTRKVWVYYSVDDIISDS